VTDEGGYGRFGALSRVELERFFYLDDEDRKLIAGRRRDYNRLGFALQVVTVRQLGMFLADPLDVPPELIDYLAEQLGIEDSSCVKQYTERDKTKLEHAWEIQREYDLTSFGEVESELAAWVADQAWVTGDGPKAMFAGAVDASTTEAPATPAARSSPSPNCSPANSPTRTVRPTPTISPTKEPQPKRLHRRWDATQRSARSAFRHGVANT